MKQKEPTNLPRKHNLIVGSYLPAIISFVILVLIDQLSKYAIQQNMNLYDSIPLIKDIFEIHYIRNAGAAWGMFQNKQLWFYISTSIFLAAGVLFYIRCKKAKRFRDIQALLVLILSGAVGNFIDRLRFRYVIDFLYFKLIDFPVFNIADCYITIGFFLLLFLFIFKYQEEDIDFLIKR